MVYETSIINTGYGIVFDAQFINDCAWTQFTYVLMRFIVGNANERRPFSRFKQVQVPASNFEDQRLERTDFAVVHTLVHRSEQGQV